MPDISDTYEAERMQVRNIWASPLGWKLLQWLIAVHEAQCSQFLGLSKRAVMLCNSQIVVSIFGRGANCREADIPLRHIAVVFRSFQAIRHDAPPSRRK